MIEARGVGKQFGDRWVLRDLSLIVQPGECVGVLGRNGAGKTTLVRLLTGQLRPSSGLVLIAGHDASSRPLALRRLVGVMPEEGALLEDLSGAQYLAFVGRIHGLDGRTLEGRIRELQDHLQVDFQQACAIRDYSYGMKKKLAFCSALLHQPRLLFLDEPFEGLDPAITQTLLELLGQLQRRGITLVLTSHLLPLVERICTRFLFLDEGTTLLDQSAQELNQSGESLETAFLRRIKQGHTRELTWI